MASDLQDAQNSMSADSKSDFEKLSWDILDKLFLKPKTLVQHQIESYNDCIENQIPKIIKQYNPLVIHGNFDGNRQFKRTYVFNFGEVFYSRPEIHDSGSNPLPMFPV